MIVGGGKAIAGYQETAGAGDPVHRRAARHRRGQLGCGRDGAERAGEQASMRADARAAYVPPASAAWTTARSTWKLWSPTGIWANVGDIQDVDTFLVTPRSSRRASCPW
ncbi:MAG: hypothetical protein R3A10_23805 [Caldilineaceae bacterium]